MNIALPCSIISLEPLTVATPDGGFAGFDELSTWLLTRPPVVLMKSVPTGERVEETRRVKGGEPGQTETYLRTVYRNVPDLEFEAPRVTYRTGPWRFWREWEGDELTIYCEEVVAAPLALSHQQEQVG